jgi:malonate transporter and related proteins
MQAILTVTVPFFVLVLAGYLSARQHLLPESAIPGLNAYVLFIALPCMLLRFGINTPVLELLNPMVLAVYLVCGLVVVAFTVAVTLGPQLDLKNAAFGALVAAFPNTGFLGVPLLVALLGPAAAGPAICTILADLVVTSSLCIALAQAHGGGEHGSRDALKRSLRGVLVNPLPWAIALGATLSVAGVGLPTPVHSVVGMLADSASPVALFTIGAVLWRAGQHVHTRTPPQHYVPVALIKLLVHPLLVLAVGSAARALGAPLSGFALLVITLVAALPSASNVSLLAERYGADNGRIARIIMASTVLAFFTLAGLAWLMGLQPPG